MTFFRSFRSWPALAPMLLLGLVPAAQAVDGVTLINQATALNGLPGCHANGLPIIICQPGSYRLAWAQTDGEPAGNVARSGRRMARFIVRPWSTWESSVTSFVRWR